MFNRVAAVVAVVVAMAAPAVVLAASGGGGQPSPPDPLAKPGALASPAELQAQKEELEAKRKKPEEVAARKQSRTKFQNLPSEQVEALVRDRGTPMKTLGGHHALNISGDEKLDRFVDDHTARVTKGDKAFMVASDVPLRTKDEHGELRLVDLALDLKDKDYLPKNPLVRATLPDDLDDGLELPDDGLILNVDAARRNAKVQRVGDTLVYPNSASDVDAVLKPIPTGTEIGWIVRSPKAPEAFRFTVRSDSEAHPVKLVEVEGNQGIGIFRDGEPTVHIMRPVAVDNDGYTVETEMRIEGNDTIVVTAKHHSADLKYPLHVDPGIVDIRNWRAGSQNVAGWNYWTSHQNAFSWAYAPPSGSGPPYDAGFYVGAYQGLTYGANSYGEWVYPAPHDAYIFRTFLSYMGHVPDGTSYLAGIYDWRGLRWEPNSYFTIDGWVSGNGPMQRTQSFGGNQVEVCASQGCSYNDGSAGNLTVQGLVVNSNHYMANGALAYMGGAEISMYDRDTPTVQVLSGAPPANGWLDLQQIDINVRTHDAGLGPWVTYYYYPFADFKDRYSSHIFDSTFNNCFGVICNTYFDGHVQAWAANMPTGKHDNWLKGYDWGERNTGNQNLPQLKIDHRSPVIDLPPALASAPTSSQHPLILEDSSYDFSELRAHDDQRHADDQAPSPNDPPSPPQSGVKRLKVELVDLNNNNSVIPILDIDAPCATDGCTKQGTADHKLIPSDLAPHLYRMDVTAVDGVGRTTVDQRYVYVPPGRLLAPLSGDRFASKIPLQAETTHSGLTGATFFYQPHPTSSTPNPAWHEIPANQVTLNGSTISGWPVPVQSSGKTELLQWDARATGLDEGALRVVASFAGSPNEGLTNVADIFLDRSFLGANFATAALGPGELTLGSGNYALTSTDVLIGAIAGDLSVSRTYNTRAAAQTPVGPLGPGWTLATPLISAGITYTKLVVASSGVVTATLQDGTEIPFAPESGAYVSPLGFTDLKLTKVGSDYEIADDSGNQVRFHSTDGSATLTPKSLTQAANSNVKTTWKYRIVGNTHVPEKVIAPNSGVTCGDYEPPAYPAAGCRALEFSYATSTNAQAGEYQDRLKQVSFVAADPAGNMSRTPVAEYRYDSSGRLTEQWDPRIVPNALKHDYDYDATTGVMTDYTPPGERPWHFTYTTTSDDTAAGRLRAVSRDALPGTATWTVQYDVPLSGPGLPDLTEGEVGRWGQTDPPRSATAIFPPTQVPGSPVSSYSHATIHYLNANLLEVNTAEPGGQISTTEYDRHRNAIRELSATNRDRALNEGANSADFASRYDTRRAYSPDGTRLIDEFGPEHQMQASSNIVNGRTHTHYDYNEGSVPTEGGPYNVVTRKTVSARVGNADSDQRTVQYGFDSDVSWKLRKPTSVTIDPYGLAITSRTSYDAATGQVTQSRMPSDAAGTTAATLNIRLYTAGPGPNADCDNKPALAGLPCQETPAAQPTGGPPIPSTGYTYDRLFQATTTFEVSSNLFKHTTTDYDAAGRATSAGVVSNSGTSLPTVTLGYHAATGRQTTASYPGATITREYDPLGRLDTYTDIAGAVTGTDTEYTYDTNGRVTRIDDGKGERTVNSYDLNNNPTSITDSQIGAGMITATYDADNQLLTQMLPNGICATYTYDQTGVPTRLAYKKATNCAASGPTWLEFGAVRNAHGQIVQYAGTGPTGTQYYAYDNAGRLTHVFDVRGGECHGRVYRYDGQPGRNSNRTSVTAVQPLGGGVCDFSFGGAATASSYDTADRLTGTGITYDPMGNTTALPAGSAGGSALAATYFADNRVASLTQAGTSYTYTLDPMRRVLARGTTGSKTMHYGDDSDNPMWTGENVGESQYTRLIAGAGGDLIATYSSATGTLTYQLADLHGDIVATAAQDSSITGLATQYDADEFGAPRTAAPRYGWLGAKERTSESPTGTILMGRRVYQPQIGRFLQTDPIKGGSANAYDYVSQDPINSFDLDGEARRGPGGHCYDWGGTKWKRVPESRCKGNGGTSKGVTKGSRFIICNVGGALVSYPVAAAAKIMNIGKKYLPGFLGFLGGLAAPELCHKLAKR